MFVNINRKFLNIYTWDLISFISRFGVLFVATPFLASNPVLFGIYSLCISISIFLNYADIGFLKASKKYAAEEFAKGSLNNELSYLGFGTFILFLLTIIFSIITIYISTKPELLISNLDKNEREIAQLLLLTLSVSSVIVPFRRLAESIFKIRLDNHLFKIVNIVVSLFTLAAATIFLTNDYQIVEYFLTMKILEWLGVFVAFYIIEKRYSISFRSLLVHINYRRGIYRKLKSLAYAGLFLMFSWIVFYELDQIYIAKRFDAKSVSMYAIAWTFPVLLRQIFGIIYTPIVERANHLVGDGNFVKLKELLTNVLFSTMPLTVLPAVALGLFSDILIVNWVGEDFSFSAQLASFLSYSFVLASVSYLMDLYLMALEKVKFLYVSAIIPPLIFWLGLWYAHLQYGLEAIALFKMIAMFVVQGFYIYLFFHYKLHHNKFWSNWPLILIALLAVLLVGMKPVILNIMDYLNVLDNLILSGIIILFVLILLMLVYGISLKYYRILIVKKLKLLFR